MNNLDEFMVAIAKTEEYNDIRKKNDRLINDLKDKLPKELLPEFIEVIDSLTDESVYMQTEIYRRAVE